MTRRAIVTTLAFLLLAPLAAAGGGPETTLLVVNARSPASLEVANRWASARGLPESHVVWIDDVPNLHWIGLDEFLEVIWKPIAAHLERLPDIDTVVYSADFPYAVDVSSLFDKKSPPPQRTGQPIASLTGVTYLWRRTVARDPTLVSLTANRYYVPGTAATRDPTRAEVEHWRAAQGALDANDLKTAAERLDKLLATYVESPPAWYNYACCLAMLGRPDDAVKALSSAVDHGWTEAEHTERDEHLASIRDRPELAEILRRMRTAGGFVAARAFDATKKWGRDDRDRYLLCTMLGYSGSLGNTVPEINAYLAAAIGADGTKPNGTVYLPKNENVRSTARHGFFPATAKALRDLGRKAEIIENAKLPTGKDDVIGVVAGTAAFDWSGTKSRILPGAICEHLTSFGARFAAPGQTKISELLRHGAAGSSGTVVEPYAILQKFPHPFLHVYYAQGSSLAEAFYQSVWGPFQLLIVGDPLARPYATFREVALASPAADAPWKGTAQVRGRADGPIATLELWVDGRRVASGRPGEAFSLDTTKLADGFHDVRLVAVEASAVATRSDLRLEVRVDNHGRRVETGSSVGDVPDTGTLAIDGTAPGAKHVELRQGVRTLARAEGTGRGGRFTLRTPAAVLGLGPSAVRVVAVHAEGAEAYGPRISVNVVPGKLTGGDIADPKRVRLAGLVAHVRDAKGPRSIMVPSLAVDERGRPVFASQVTPELAGSVESMTIEGEFQVPAAGSYRLLLGSNAALGVTVDGTERLAETAPRAGQRGVRLDLAAGWHSLALTLTGGARPWLSADLGGAIVSRPLDELSARHLTELTRLDRMPEIPLDGVTKGVFPGSGLPIPAEGVVLEYDRAIEIAAVVIHPHDDGKSPVVWPDGWVVETRRGRGAWKAVDDLSPRAGGPGRPRRDKNHTPPTWYLLEFKPRRTDQIRIRLADLAEGGVGPTIDGIEAFGRGK